MCAELAAGAKGSHWMWLVFPQQVELGFPQFPGRFV